jgi:hypothetical protein
MNAHDQTWDRLNVSMNILGNLGEKIWPEVFKVVEQRKILNILIEKPKDSK